MRPGGTPEKPTIIIEPQDVELLRFGMSGGPAVLAPEKHALEANFLQQRRQHEGAHADFWRETIEIEATHGNIALCGLAMQGALNHALRKLTASPVEGSVTEVSARAEIAIAETAEAALVKLAQGGEEYEDILATQAELWRAHPAMTR